MSARWRLILTVVALGLSVFVVTQKSAQLGLDLKGGTQVVLNLKPRPGQTLSGNIANDTLSVLRKRVDSLGVTEPNLEVAGKDRIIVELPGVREPEEARNVIGKTAQLTVHPVISVGQAQSSASTTQPASPSSQTTNTTTPPGTTATTAAGLGNNNSDPRILGQAATTPSSTPPTTTTASTATTAPTSPLSANQDQSGALTASDDKGNVYQLGPSVINGDGIDTATAEPPDTRGHSSWYLQLRFKGAGSSAWTKLTGEEACKGQTDPTRQNAFVLDGKVIQASGPSPQVQCNQGISGDTEISGSDFKENDVKQLALLIRGGALPVDVQVASSQSVGPELGKAAIDASRNAVIIGGILTIAFILVYYHVLGLLAAVALGAYTLISYAVLVGLKLTLTLPGIAGFVLAIAMAMDSNVLVYERVKEEHAHGRSVRQSAQLGFKNALSAIIDSNATTFIAALTLFFLASGEVKGFGVTLLVGTAASIFVTLVILRTLVSSALTTSWAPRHTKLLGLHIGARFRTRMAERPPNIMRASKYFLTVSVVLVLIGVGGILAKGIDFGIEFTGGRLLEYKTTHPTDVDKVRKEVARLGFPRAVVQRSDNSNTSVRVASLTKQQETQLDSSMRELGGGTADRVRNDNIGPSFGNELKNKAFLALGVGIALQLAWVAYRFRWTFGIGAVLAMVHDALLTVGLFAWLGKPFDAVFLAALLTIIAYSVNDSVVVFDRIREQRRRRTGESFATIVSDACAQTFPRTVNIGLSALFILAALFFLGGDALGDFALALLVGVVTGVYSSVMVASPIAVLLERWKPGTTGRPVKSRTSQGPSKPKSTSSSSSSTTAPSSTSTTRPTPRPRKKKRH